jgi:hypothetical protein
MSRRFLGQVRLFLPVFLPVLLAVFLPLGFVFSARFEGPEALARTKSLAEAFPLGLLRLVLVLLRQSGRTKPAAPAVPTPKTVETLRPSLGHRGRALLDLRGFLGEVRTRKAGPQQDPCETVRHGNAISCVRVRAATGWSLYLTSNESSLDHAEISQKRLSFSLQGVGVGGAMQRINL